MKNAELLELYDLHERFEANYPRYRREEAGKIVRMVSLEAEAHNVVIHSRLGAEDADRAISGELEYFRELGSDFEWKLYSHDQPSDLKDRLAARGFSVGDDEAIMSIELESLGFTIAAASSIDVRKVTDEKGLKDFADVNARVWSDKDDSWMKEVAETLRGSPQRMSAWLAYVEGEPVCAARIDFPERSPFASLWGGATVERHRGRGLYTAVLAARAKEAIERGYRFLTIDAGPMSRPIVERLGFRLLAISNPCDSPKR